MVYKKSMKICIALSIILGVLSTVVFGVTDIEVKSNVVATKTMEVLIYVSRYSWPVMVIVFAYAMYQYYVIGAEEFEHKAAGQKLILGASMFMAILQSLPLICAFITVGM